MIEVIKYKVFFFNLLFLINDKKNCLKSSHIIMKYKVNIIKNDVRLKDKNVAITKLIIEIFSNLYAKIEITLKYLLREK